jgi:hypothetical protein
MRSLLKFRIILLSILFIVIIIPEVALCNGGKGKIVYYISEVSVGKGVCQFSTELEKVIFCLTTVRNKYKLVRIKIVNSSETPLILSSGKDKIMLAWNQHEAYGILNLAKEDPDMWDTFEAGMRETLVYPKIVEPGEEENIFVFFPEQNWPELPDKFLYVINSQSGKQILISKLNNAVAK